MAMQMRGRTGELRKGYQVAARLGPWTLDDGGRVEAQPASVDQHWLDAPGGWALWLHLGKKGSWVWRDVQVVSQGPPMVMRVGGSPVLR